MKDASKLIWAICYRLNTISVMIIDLGGIDEYNRRIWKHP